MGVAHCTNFANRLYPVRDPNLGLLFANTLRARCPRFFPANAFAALDTTNFRFDAAYFRNVLSRRGLLTVDSELGLDPRTGPVAANFASNPGAFFAAFASAYVKLSSFGVAAPGRGEVRLNCHVRNS
jgi:peroxidase